MKFWIIIYICMMAMPLIIAFLYFKVKKSQVLHIRQDYVKDTRYFGRSFAKMVEKALPEMKDGTLMLSKPEKVLEIEQNQTFADSEIEDLVIARNIPFCPQGENLNFQKEIYSENDAILTSENINLRAIYSKKRLLIGNGSKILRWADAEDAVAIYDHCELGTRISSGEQLVVGFDNKFHSLFAPVIWLGKRPDDSDEYMKNRDSRIFRLPILNSYTYNRHYIYDDMISEEGIVPYTILSNKDVKVTDHIILQGDIHSDSSVRIMEGAAVLGNVFAEKDILLERNATVLGNVFTQGNIIFEEGASVGQPNKTCSVIAREKITFYGKNYVFGYIGAEGGGEIRESEENSDKVDYCFPPEIIHEEKLIFKNLEEYENVNHQGFRLDRYLKSVVIPLGAAKIPESQFFGCTNIEEMQLPKSITAIEDYAFADCVAMKLKESLEGLPLKTIGISAFENCRALVFSGLSDTLQSIGGAAFAGCESLETLIFSDKAALSSVGDHAFRDCKNLKKVYLPDNVEYVGVSAFMGCGSLKKISVPESVRTQPGIMEIAENCPNAQIQFRPVEAKDLEDKKETTV